MVEDAVAKVRGVLPEAAPSLGHQQSTGIPADRTVLGELGSAKQRQT